MKKNFILILSALLFLSGCASNELWRHPEKGGDGRTGAEMTLAECQRYAYGLEPEPTPVARMDVPAPSSYVTHGTYQQYGSNGTFTARTQAQNSSSRDFAANYNSGASLGEALASIAYQNKIKKITKDCMISRGWIDTSTEEGRILFSKEKENITQKSILNNKSSINLPEWR